MADFKATVEGCGGTAIAWSQGKFIKDKQAFGQNGVCGPLSAKWIKDRKLKINFKADTALEEGREEVMQLKINQHTKPSTYVEDYLKMAGLSKTFDKTYEGEISLSQLLADATSGPGYAFIGVSSLGVGGKEGHAFGVDMATKKVFDSNCGQASFETVEQMKSFFSLWFRLAYMDLRGSSLVSRYI